MNWKLIFQLSLFGLVMGISTVYFIPSNIEWICWLVIFIICAIIVAKQCSEKYFLTGVCVSLVSSVWITASHVLLYTTYAANHQPEMAMMHGMPMATHPRIMMMLTGPVFGVVFGMILGLFCFVASKSVKKR